MINQNQFFIWLGVPWLMALVAFFVPRRIKSIVTLITLILLFIFGLTISSMSPQKIVLDARQWGGVSFYSDGFAFIMAFTVLVVSSLISLYSIGYMKKFDKLAEFYFLFLLFVGSMIGLIFSDHLILLYLFWEITALCSWRLIGFFREDKHTTAANQALIITSIGAVAMLCGIAIIYITYGTFSLSQLKAQSVALLPSILIIAGILSKSAQLPFHLWLPDAGVAPTPVTALLHAAVLVKIGVYAFFRLFCMNMAIDTSVREFVLVLSVVTSIASAAAASKENDIKRILAYSTISQIAYIMFAFSLNTHTGVVAGFLYLIAHSLGKAGLFLSAGIIEHSVGSKNIESMGGLKKILPLTNAAFLMCAFSIVGIPPFGGFFGKFMVISAAMDSHRYLAAAALLSTAVLTVYYLFRLYAAAFSGELKSSYPKEGTTTMVFSVLIFGVLSLALGFTMNIPFKLLHQLL